MIQHLRSWTPGGKSLHVIENILLEVVAGTFNEMKAKVTEEYSGKNILEHWLSFSWVLDTMIGDIRAICDYKTMKMNLSD